jgi:hypothetical protein
VPQIQPEFLYVSVALLFSICSFLLSVILFIFVLKMLQKSRNEKFGTPDQWVLDEVKNRIQRQRREAAVDAFAEELRPGEVVVADE